MENCGQSSCALHLYRKIWNLALRDTLKHAWNDPLRENDSLWHAYAYSKQNPIETTGSALMSISECKNERINITSAKYLVCSTESTVFSFTPFWSFTRFHSLNEQWTDFMFHIGCESAAIKKYALHATRIAFAHCECVCVPQPENTRVFHSATHSIRKAILSFCCLSTYLWIVSSFFLWCHALDASERSTFHGHFYANEFHVFRFSFYFLFAGAILLRTHRWENWNMLIAHRREFLLQCIYDRSVEICAF